MMLIRGCAAIEAIRTINPPTSHEVNQTSAFDRTEQYAAFMYRFSKGWMYCGSHETIEEAVRVFEEHKALSLAFPDVLNWLDVSDMVIMARNGANPRNPSDTRWFACSMVVDE